ncbi:hypothetical protein V8C37DRAFT_399052 [Trichoderma ceciliae]
MAQPEEPEDGGEVQGNYEDDALAREEADNKKKKKKEKKEKKKREKSDKKLGEKEKLSAVPNLAAPLANEISAYPDHDPLAMSEGKPAKAKELSKSKPRKDKSNKAKKSKASEAE